MNEERGGEGILPPGVTAARVAGKPASALAGHVPGVRVPETHVVARPPHVPAGMRTRVPGPMPAHELLRERTLGIRLVHRVGNELIELNFNGSVQRDRGGLERANTMMFEPEEYGGEGEGQPIVPIRLSATNNMSVRWVLGRHSSCELQVTNLESVSEFALFITYRRGNFDVVGVSRSQFIALLTEKGAAKEWRSMTGAVTVTRGSAIAFIDKVSEAHSGVYLVFV